MPASLETNGGRVGLSCSLKRCIGIVRPNGADPVQAPEPAPVSINTTEFLILPKILLDCQHSNYVRHEYHDCDNDEARR